MRGRGRLAAAAVPAPLRAGRAPRRPRRAARGRRLRVGDVRGSGGRVGARAQAARREARLRPRLRARAAVRALRRHAGGVPVAPRSRPVRVLQGSPHALAAGARARSSSRAPTWPGSPPAGGSGATGSTSSRTPRPRRASVEPERLEPGTFVFVGRLTRQKALGTAIEAIALVPEARLVLVGDGPERAGSSSSPRRRPAAGRIEFRGSLSRDDALRIVAGAEAALLSSDWENLPHAAVEALSVGVPVVATSRRRRARGRPRRRERAARAAGAPGRARGCDPARARGGRAARPPGRRRRSRPSRRSRARRSTAGSSRCSPRRLRERSPAARPLRRARRATGCRCPDWLAKKWDAVEEQLDYRFLGAAEAGARSRDRALPARRRPPGRGGSTASSSICGCRCGCAGSSMTSSPTRSSPPIRSSARRALLGRALARAATPVIVEVHGDWRTFARLYGSPSRRLFARAADGSLRYVIRRADATRALSRFTSGLIEEVRGRPADAVFPTYSDLSAFTAEPVRAAARAADRALRRDAGGVQERRRARGRLAARRRGRARGAARDRRPRDAAGGGRPARPRISRRRSSTCRCSIRTRSRVRSTRRRCSSSRRGPKVWAAS